MYMYNVDHTQTSFKFYCPENEGLNFLQSVKKCILTFFIHVL